MRIGGEPLHRIGLGTAQFGFGYGITNRRGKITQRAAGDILRRAHTLGVKLLDTAPSYFKSETVIGNLDPENLFNVVTKTRPIQNEIIGPNEADRVEREFDATLNTLSRDSVEGLLVHHGSELLLRGSDNLIRLLMVLKESGRAKKIGVSVYSAAELDGILKRFNPDIVQLPISIADQRLLQSGHLKRLRSAGVEIHARSIFLQGTLLTPVCKLPPFLQNKGEDFRRIFKRAYDLGTTALGICLAFAFQVTELDKLIVGVTSIEEFEEIATTAQKISLLNCDWDQLAFKDAETLDPSQWAVNS